MGCSALLSVVSQLLSVCNPADSLVRLQRGATPVAACLQSPAELCKAVAAAPHTFGNRLLVFPSCQNIIVLVGGVVLPLPHAASGANHLARCPPCKACQKSATLPVRLHAAIRACLRCLLPAGTALHSQFFSVMLLLRHPHAGFGAYRRAAQKVRRKNRKDNQCLRSAKGVLLLCPHADFGAGQRQVSPPL